MDFHDSVRIIGRWWFVTVPLVVLTVIATVVLTNGVQPEYQADGSILFVGPTTRESEDRPGETEPVNPLIEQPAALTTAAVVSALSMNSPQVADILAREGLSTNYEFGTEARTPILLFYTRASSRELATATALRLVELVSDDVQLQQEAAGVPADERVTTNLIGLSATGGADYGGRRRMQIVILVLGLGTAFGMAFLLEGIDRRRKSRRPEGATASSDGRDGPGDDDGPRPATGSDTTTSGEDGEAVTSVRNGARRRERQASAP